MTAAGRVLALAVGLWLACASAYAWELQDASGRVVSGPGPAVQRIATLAPHLAELVFAAGAGDRLVAAVAYSDYPAAARAVPRIGDAFAVSLEALVAARPELVLAWGGGTPIGLVARLRDLGLAVAVLRMDGLDDVAAHVRLVGRLAGTSAIAEVAAHRYESRLAALRDRYAGRSPVRVFYQVSLHPLFTVNGGQSISRVLALCGGRNVFAGLAAAAPRVSVEAVLAADPGAILFSRDGDAAAVRAFWAQYPVITAVREGAIHPVAADRLVRPTPRLIAGIRSVCQAMDRARAAMESR